MKQKKSSSGQVVLITLLVLTIATTVALSLISRTTTDTTITNQTEESSRAFSAAEAGIEEALKTGIGTSNTPVTIANGVSYNTVVSTVGSAVGIFEFPKKTLKGMTETVWLANHDDATGIINEATLAYTAPSIDICWSTDTTTIPALAITLLYKESSDGSYRVAKAGFDPVGARATTNKFDSGWTPGGCGGTTQTYYRKTLTFSALNSLMAPQTIDPTSDLLIALRIRPLYNDAKIAIDAGSIVLPKQGNRIESLGTTIGGTNRKVVVYQQYRSPSSVFDAAIYSQGSIQQ
jgi:Tfp pilus assembly protein PilX